MLAVPRGALTYPRTSSHTHPKVQRHNMSLDSSTSPRKEMLPNSFFPTLGLPPASSSKQTNEPGLKQNKPTTGTNEALCTAAKAQRQSTREFWMKIVYKDFPNLLTIRSQHSLTWDQKKLLFLGSREMRSREGQREMQGKLAGRGISQGPLYAAWSRVTPSPPSPPSHRLIRPRNLP